MFQLAILSSQDDVVRMQLSGQVGQAALPELSRQMEESLGPEPYRRKVLLDMAQTTFLDSSALGWFLGCNKQFREGAGILVLHSVAPVVLDVMRVMRLDRVLQIAEDERAALALARAPQGDTR
jgi:anti-anti-sigma factor